MREGLREAVSQLHSAVGALNTRVMTAEGEMLALRRQLEGGQEKTLVRLSEVTNSIGHFHTAVNSCRDEIRDSKQDIEKFRDMMAITINKEYGSSLNKMMRDLSQFRDETKIEYEELLANHKRNEQSRHFDPSGFEQHINNVVNKLQSDSRFHGDIARDCRDRVERMDAKVNGLHARLYEMANDLILLRDKPFPVASLDGSVRSHEFQRTVTVLKSGGEDKVRQMSPLSRVIEEPPIRPDQSIAREERLLPELITPQIDTFRTLEPLHGSPQSVASKPDVVSLTGPSPHRLVSPESIVVSNMGDSQVQPSCWIGSQNNVWLPSNYCRGRDF